MGTQYGVSGSDYPCTRDGQDCRARIYARSLAGVVPSADITWLQAQQACANVGKRLPTNAEWQRAVAGTPDTGGADDGSTTCVTDGSTAQETGSRSGCVSKWGTHDMVGNLWEWVADWMPASDACPGWGSFSDDDMCLAGVNRGAPFPAALIRGGGAGFAAAAGPLAVRADFAGPGSFAGVIGFRCARAPF
jgi:formylglycine-generating enzyme required for sulfatase activity